MPDLRFPGDDDAFAALVLRFLDAATTHDEEAALNAELGDSGRPARRDLYVSLCRQRGVLAEAMTAKFSGRSSSRIATRSAPWKLLLGAAAAIVAGIVGFFVISKDEPILIAVVERAKGVSAP